MTALREDEFDSFLKRKVASMNGLLIHGSDSGAVNALAKQVIRTVAGENGSSFATTRFDASILKDDEGRLTDEFRSLSLLGERRVILVDGVEDGHLKFFDVLLTSKDICNFVVLLSDALGKSSKVRLAVEGSTTFASLAIYEEDAPALGIRVRNLLALEGLSWDVDAEELFFSTVGYERSTVVEEAKKLALYCLGFSKISVVDVESICGDTAGFGADELIDAALAGDLDKVDRSYAGLDSDSGGTKAILSIMLLHLTKLQNYKLDMERGLNADAVVRNAKPPIFFKRRNSIVNQLRVLSLDQLIEMQHSVSQGMFQTRKNADLFDAITSRTLLSLARLARSLR